MHRLAGLWAVAFFSLAVTVLTSAAPSAEVDNQAFSLIAAWGHLGTGEGEFGGPWGVAVGDDGYIYVADTGNHRIQKFDTAGHFITVWGSQGSGPGQFDRPYAILVRGGYAYVTDTFNHRIQKFTTAGQFVSQYNTSGNVYGIAADSASNMSPTLSYGLKARCREFGSNCF